MTETTTGPIPWSERVRRQDEAARTAVLVLPVAVEWVGTTPRVTGADGISPIVCANGQIARQVADAVNTHTDLLAALEAVYDGLPPNRYTSDEAVEIVRQLRNIMADRQVGALISGARGIGQNIDTRA